MWSAQTSEHAAADPAGLRQSRLSEPAVPEPIADRGRQSHRRSGERRFHQSLGKGAEDTDPSKLSRRAETLISLRTARAKMFDTSLFGEPAWDILLVLYVAAAKGERLLTKCCCLSIDCPQSTALRHLKELVRRGLVSRERSLSDRRSTYVSLSEQGKAAMECYLEACAFDPARIRD